MQMSLRRFDKPITLQTTTTRRYRQCDWGVCTPLSIWETSTPHVIQTGSWSRSWVRTPNYRALVKSGALLPDNPFSLTIWSLEPSSTVKVEGSSGWSDSYGNSVMDHAVSTGPLRTLYSEPGWIDNSTSYSSLVVKLFDKMKGPEFSVPLFIAEAGKTVQMITQTANTLSEVIRALRRGRIDVAASKLGLAVSKRKQRKFSQAHLADPTSAAANAWLQLKYGWTPLLMDCKSAAETLADVAIREDAQVCRVRVSTSRAVTNVIDHPFSGTVFGDGVVRVVTDEEHSRRFSIRFRCRPGEFLGSLGLQNPYALVWELVPFSFVADWFLPLGDYLQHLDVSQRFEFISGTHSTKGVLEGSASLSQSAKSVIGLGSDTFKRVEISSVPFVAMPELTLLAMDVKFDLSIAKMTTSLALLRQNASRLMPKKP